MNPPFPQEHRLRAGALCSGPFSLCPRRAIGSAHADHSPTALLSQASQNNSVLIGKRMVGAAGFEPTTPTPPVWCATRLRYAPTITLLAPRSFALGGLTATGPSPAKDPGDCGPDYTCCVGWEQQPWRGPRDFSVAPQGQLRSARISLSSASNSASCAAFPSPTGGASGAGAAARAALSPSSSLTPSFNSFWTPLMV